MAIFNFVEQQYQNESYVSEKSYSESEELYLNKE